MMGQGIISPVLPLIARDYDVGLTLVGFTLAVFGLGRLFSNLPAGILSERYGRRAVLIAGLVILTAASVLMALIDSFVALVVFRLLSGVGAAIYITSAMTMLVDISTPANRARYMSLQQGSILLGVGIGPAVGGFSAEIWGFRSAFYLMAVLSAAGLAWAVLQMPETNVTRGGRRAADGTTVDGRSAVVEGDRASLMSILRNRDFILVAVYFFMVVFTRNGGRALLVPLVGDAQVGLGPGEIGVAFTVMLLVNMVLVVPAGVISDRWGRKVLMLPGALLTAAGLVLYVFSGSFGMFLLASVVMGIGTGVVGPSPAAYVADLAPPGRQGVTIGLYRTFGDLGGFIGPVFLGWFSDAASFAWALNVNAVLVVLSAVAMVALAAEQTPASRSRGDVAIEV